MMGLDTWEVFKQRGTKEMANSMFNFEEGPKRKMLKVQYFKHHVILSICMIGTFPPMEDYHGTMRFLFILKNYFMHNSFWE